MIRRNLILGAFVLGMASSSCAHMYDPLTVQHLEVIAKDRGLRADTCASYVAYERAKQSEKSPKFDPKSLRNMEEACDCVADAGADTGVVRKSCETSISGYVAYEHAKQK